MREYRTNKFYPVMGVLALLIFTYIVLCNVGALPWIFLGDVTLESTGYWAAMSVIFAVPALVLFWVSRIRVSLDERGFRYMGVVKSRAFSWGEITRIKFRYYYDRRLGPRDIQIWSNTERVCIPFIFKNDVDLRQRIVRNARTWSENVIVDEDPEAIAHDE